MNKGYKYSVIEEKDDFKDSVIEKSNVTVKFTLNQIEADKVRVEKMKKELESNLTLRQAEMTNLEAHHEYVKDVSSGDVFRAQIIAFYFEKKSEVEKMKTKLAEIEKVFTEYAEEVKEIEAQIGKVVNVIETL